jgi:steroid delta-isomerase-like uncharacterized protein
MAAAAVTEALTETEQRNLRAVTGVHPFWDAGDLDGVLAFYDDDIVWTNVALDEVYEGKAAVRAYLQELFAAIPDLTFRAPTAIARGDTVAEKWVVRGTHLGTWMGVPATGRPIEILGMSMITLRDGKFLRDDFYFDTGSVMRQLGLMPSLAITKRSAVRVFLWLAVKSLGLVRRRPVRT